MNGPSAPDRRKAGITAALLVLAGIAFGIVLDRTWLMPSGSAMPLTADALAAELELGPTQETRLRALLDSMHVEVLTAAEQGPAALAAAAARAHQRLEASLPPEARPGLRAWLDAHHRQMIDRMGGGSVRPPS